MKVLLYILFLASFISCATGIIPKEERQLTFVKETSQKKEVNHSKAMEYFSKTFQDISSTLKRNDLASQTIILKGNIACNLFRQTGDINDYSLHFILTVDSKDKKIRFLFEDLFIAHATGQPVMWAYNQLSDKEKVQQAGNCLKPLMDGVLSSINKKDIW